MKQSKVIQVLSAKLDQRQQQILGLIDRKTGLGKSHVDALASLDVSNVASMAYRKRSNYFTSSNKGNCGFSPETMAGHSYGWYSLVKRIKGKVILNTYCYSRETAKHISKVSSVMRLLGIKYQSLEAPRGLQDLEASVVHHSTELGRAIVADKYARIKGKGMIQYHRKALRLLKALGHKSLCLDVCIEQAEKERAEKLERNREKSEKKRITAKLKAYLDRVAFRDYDVADRSQFGKDNYIARKVAVHQCVDADTLESDVENALYSFQRDGFGSIVFYVGSA